LPIGEKIDRRKRLEISKKSFVANRERENKEKEHNQIKIARESALDEWSRLDKQRMKYMPKNENEDLHPLFVEAIMKMPHAEFILGCIEMELDLYETRNRGNT
jgi:hypothetical protein